MARQFTFTDFIQIPATAPDQFPVFYNSLMQNNDSVSNILYKQRI